MPISSPFLHDAESPNPQALSKKIASWYGKNARALPWRIPGTSPWAVLVSEVMSQQTPVARVAPLWEAWMERWPTPADLAAAAPADVLKMWANLGYPRRALRLRECASAVTQRHGGELPRDVDSLLALPGVGEYTARAVAAFALEQAVPVVDTNVRRVYKRLVRGEYLQGAARSRDLVDVAALLPYLDPDPAVKKADAKLSTVRPNQHQRERNQRERNQRERSQRERNQHTQPETRGLYSTRSNAAHKEAALTMCAGLMELGALVCTATNPRCAQCPLIDDCRWVALGKPEPTEEQQADAAKRVQKFTGTDRQVRGKVMALLREAGSEGVRWASFEMIWEDKPQLKRAVDSLLADGLTIKETDSEGIEAFHLPR